MFSPTRAHHLLTTTLLQHRQQWLMEMTLRAFSAGSCVGWRSFLRTRGLFIGPYQLQVTTTFLLQTLRRRRGLEIYGGNTWSRSDDLHDNQHTMTDVSQIHQGQAPLPGGSVWGSVGQRTLKLRLGAAHWSQQSTSCSLACRYFAESLAVPKSTPQTAAQDGGCFSHMRVHHQLKTNSSSTEAMEATR